MPTASTVDLHGLLTCLVNHGVRGVIIGGMSAVLQGAPIHTVDIDIVHQRTPENLDRLMAALAELQAVYRHHHGRQLEARRDILAGPDPKANNTGKAIKWRLQDLVAGWWYRAVIDGVRAIQADVVRTTKSLAPRVVFIQFESNKPTERGWAYRPVAHGAAFALSSLQPWGAWANTQAITASGGQAILDGKPVYGVDLGSQDMTELDTDLQLWELADSNGTLLAGGAADLQANLRPPAAPPPILQTAPPKDLFDAVKYKVHRQRFVDHDGLRPDDVLSRYSEAVTGASWAELRDKLLPKLDKGGTSLLKDDWLAGALAELDTLYTPPKP